ncbi:B3 domain-containing protein Os01g0723500-like [Phoenix dactylifera]|uniref:B3 domain-containing protein Os01g0723500-like n=1 Tax=Phoenix dactylifera TaxID=42345 RepID=A0A8B9A3W8_PHODC|nr:B3 domain-containing protein Os01g0723500-like [Phoenix dactylifera]
MTCDNRRRAIVREAANSFTSIFLCTIMRMTAMNVSRTYMLWFPVWFSHAHLPRRRANVVLRDPNGKAWVVVYIPSSRDHLSGGWSAFARGNNLEEGDYCVFEVAGPVEMRFHIFRWLRRSLLCLGCKGCRRCVIFVELSKKYNRANVGKDEENYHLICIL